jgi:hypothetical protein
MRLWVLTALTRLRDHDFDVGALREDVANERGSNEASPAGHKKFHADRLSSIARWQVQPPGTANRAKSRPDAAGLRKLC